MGTDQPGSDRGRTGVEPRGPDRPWSASSARPTRTLAVENEEMAAPSIISALKAASQRGVRVKVTMTDSPSGTSAWTRLTRAGVEVATYPDTPTALYIHAKAIVVDDSTAFVGSQNFSNASLGHNRELGLITSDPAVVGPWPRPWPPTSPEGPGSQPSAARRPPHPAHHQANHPSGHDQSTTRAPSTSRSLGVSARDPLHLPDPAGGLQGQSTSRMASAALTVRPAPARHGARSPHRPR